MDMSLAIIALSLHILIWEKLPDWGNWFNWLVEHSPRPIQYLYEAWRCPYCFGFWAALVLHWLTGLYTLSAVENMVNYLGNLAQPLAWFLDALATALFVMLGSLGFKAISGPAIKGYQMTMEFKNQTSAKE